MENYEDYFKNHELTVLCEHEKVKRYQFRQPDTGCYGFNITFADNLIVMNGDIYTFLCEPGYGRDGLAWMRGSLHSESYFLSKVPYNCTEALTEYKYENAIKDMKEWLGYEYITQKQFDEFMDRLEHQNGQYGESKYYELCYELDIEEPSTARTRTVTTQIQLAGMRMFLKALDSKKEAV